HSLVELPWRSNTYNRDRIGPLHNPDLPPCDTSEKLQRSLAARPRRSNTSHQERIGLLFRFGLRLFCTREAPVRSFVAPLRRGDTCGRVTILLWHHLARPVRELRSPTQRAFADELLFGSYAK